MSDLIRKSDVIGLLYKIFDEYNMSTDKTSKLRTFGRDVFKAVRGIPTAYDIDKVVEGLEEVAYVSEDVNSFVDLEDAIEIVKQGCSADNESDYCEWIKYDYRTIAPREHDINNPYWRIPENMDKLKYCPICGKKIKVVE